MDIEKEIQEFPTEKPRKFSISPRKPGRAVRANSNSLSHVSSKYESLDYDIWENALSVKEEQSEGFQHVMKADVLRWILFLIVGLATGLIAVFVDCSIDFFKNYNYRITKHYLDDCSESNCSYLVFVSWYILAVIPILLGTCVVIFVEPNAAGSGIPSIISHLNGVRIPRFTNLKVLSIKIFSVICCCSVTGFGGGKEGPYISLGAIVGSLVTSNDMSGVKFLSNKMHYFRGEKEKRDFMAGGCAAGVAAAFGSPVGATLMSLEEGASFWSASLMWKIFFCSIVSCLSFNAVLGGTCAFLGQHRSYLGSYYFGRFNETLVTYEYFELPVFFGIGALGGILGALFVAANMKVSAFRMRYVNHSKWLQTLDTLLISFLTASFGILCVHFFYDCQDYSKNLIPENTLKMSCGDGKYNGMSLFWFQTQESILRLLFHSPESAFSPQSLAIFFTVYFILVVLTLGLQISAGLFIPNLVLGATWGRLVGVSLKKIFPNAPWIVVEKYALLGAAAHLAGIVRVTISLAVVIIESTGSITFGIPLMITLFTTKWVGDLFTEDIYESQINLLGIPILPTEPPPLTNDITATDLMNTPVIVFPEVVPIGYVAYTLEQVTHHGFPVVKDMHMTSKNEKNEPIYGELRGFVLRSQLLTLLKYKLFRVPVCMADVKTYLKLFRQQNSSEIENIQLTNEELDMNVNLAPYMNPSPYSVQAVMSLPRIFRLFRSLGLRHVIVINTKNQILGIITRKNLAKFRLWRHATKMGLKELKIY